MAMQWCRLENLGRRWSPVQIRPPRPTNSDTYGQIAATAAATAVAALLLGGCSGTPAVGPSPVAVAPPPGTVNSPATSPTPRPVPAWIDQALRGTLVLVDGEGWPKRWDGGPFRHCFSVDPRVAAFAEAAAQRMTDLTGIPRTEAGPCNVEWISHAEIDHTYAHLTGTSRSVVRATVHLYDSTYGATSRTAVMHEAGHVLGLGHSSNALHLMAATPPLEADFTPEELAVLAWIYTPSTK